MRIIGKLFVLLLLLMLNASGLAQAVEKMEAPPSMRRVLRLDPRPSTFRLSARVFLRTDSLALASTIQVNYTNFTAEQRQAFQAAVDIWSQTVSSTVPIVINATWAQLDPGVLGQSGPISIWRDFTNSVPGRWYAVALANKLAGEDLDPTQADMEITFNTDYASMFYYGVDGHPAADKVDFVTTILHEICHGLGFFGSFSTDSGLGFWGYDSYPFIFDPLYSNLSNQQLITSFPNPSSELLGQMTSNNVFCTGAKTKQANGGNPVKIYAPATWQQGSSLVHWDEIYRNTPNGLMLYALSPGASIHDPGPFTLGLLQDIGWSTVSPSVPSITFSPASLNLSCSLGQNASPQTFQVWNSGGGTLTYSITDNVPWLSVTPTSGTSTGEHDTITVNYATSGLAAGTYQASITITGSGASNSPQNIPVTLNIRPALVAYYPFNGNADDASGNGYNGTVYGATLTQDRFGKSNSAYSFDGINGYIAIPGLWEVQKNDSALSFSAWSLTNSIDSDEHFMIYRACSVGEAKLTLFADKYSIAVKLADGNWYSADSAATNGKYNHIVGVYKKGEALELWVNGQLKTQTSIPNLDLFDNNGACTNDPPFVIGSYWTNSIHRWNGSLDDIRIYNVPLSASEIQTLYHEGEKKNSVSAVLQLLMD